MTKVMKFTVDGKKMRLVEVLRQGAVKFDDHTDWMLVTPDIGARGRKLHDLFWIRPGDVHISWVKTFPF